MKTFSIEEKEQIENVIRECKLCFVGMSDENSVPYVLPMNFGYEEGVIYLHSAQEGRSIRTLEKNPQVCITFCTEPQLIHQHPEVACSYRMKAQSVVCEGKIIFENEFDEKVKALNIIMRQYTDKTFKYSLPAVNNVKIWKMNIDKVMAKEFGVMQPGSTSYKDKNEF
ncbi:MAG: pyridoxamine 5'-phosphate oxidase family protein [Dysgonamonadaceae bacterium]